MKWFFRDYTGFRASEGLRKIGETMTVRRITVLRVSA